jgi:GNAT superfamily N-acetyltransferase
LRVCRQEPIIVLPPLFDDRSSLSEQLMPPFDVVITHLELDKSALSPKRSSRSDVAFSHVDPPQPALNRYFYMAVGGQWFWLERRPWTLAQWSEKVGNRDLVETWVLSVGGVPAGYVELERKGPGLVEIDYLGLLAPFIGGGLGAHLLTSACERAFAMGAGIVLLNTCNLDHPKARANYEARGFRAVRTEVKNKEIPATPPGPWEGA